MKNLVVDADGSALVLLEWTHVGLLLVQSLESTVANLRGGIDEFQLDLLQVLSLVVSKQWLSHEDWSLADAHATTLDHDEVVLHFTVVWEATNRVDALLSDVSRRARVVHVDLAAFGLVAGANAVDLLVDLDTVVVALLAASSDAEADSRRMPGTDTGDLPQTTMRLSRQLLGAPSAGHTLSAMTLGDTDAVQVVVLAEHVGDGHLLLEEASREVDLLGRVATVDLELDDVRLFLLQWQELHLRVRDESDYAAVLFDLVEGGLLSLLVGGPLLLVLGEGLLLAGAPVLVEASASLVGDVLGPDGLERSEASWRFDVADHADTNHGWRFEDGHWLDDFLLVELGALSSDFTHNVRHAGLVADETGQVARLGLVVLGVGLEAAEMAAASLSGEESL